MYRDLAPSVPGEAAAGSMSDKASRLAAAAPAERRKLLEGIVRESVAKVLRIAPARIDSRKALGAMGLGSLLAMELRNRLEAQLGLSLSATLAWNHPTVDALVAHLAGAIAPAASERRAPTAQGDATAGADAATNAAADAAPASNAAIGATVTQVAGLSDDDAARALRGARGRKPR